MCSVFLEADPDLWESKTRSIRMQGMVTSIRLENGFWRTLDEIAKYDGTTLPLLLVEFYSEFVEAGHDLGNFASFLRVSCHRFIALRSGATSGRAETGAKNVTVVKQPVAV